MATLDSQFEVTSVEPTETFTGDLTEYRFPHEDPAENWEYTFYELSEGDKSYSLMAVLEYLYKNKHSVRITVEDLGESESARLTRESAARIARERQEALAKLARESRTHQQHVVKYQRY